MTEKGTHVIGAWLQGIEILEEALKNNKKILNDSFKKQIGKAQPNTAYIALEDIINSKANQSIKSDMLYKWLACYELDIMITDRKNLKAKLEIENNGEN